MIFLDTDVMVDILRKYPPAVEWLDSLGPEEIGIPGVVAMELLQGCRNRAEQQKVERTLDPQRLFWPDQVDCERAYEDFAAYHLSHQVGILDALIAETAAGSAVQLATFNVKHYDVVRRLQTIQPYPKERG